MLLIDGKYLLTGYMTKKTQRLFRMANWIIRKELEKRPGYAFDTESLGTSRKPRHRELIALDVEPTTAERLEVEWLYSYLSDDGERTHSAWFNRKFDEWLVHVRGDEPPVQFVKMTVAGAPDNPWHEHQTVHQLLAMTGRTVTEHRWEYIPSTVDSWLNGAPHGLGTDEATNLFLLSRGIPVGTFAAHASSDAVRDQIRTANAKAQTVRAALERRRIPTTDPVLLINGKWVLTGATAGSTERVFQILNWIRENQ